jgi:hypothetical protein
MTEQTRQSCVIAIVVLELRIVRLRHKKAQETHFG